ncbi:MAG TPA: phage baseplate assembly protein V [Allosphingosinicella sp.]
MVDDEAERTYCELKGHNNIARPTRHGGSRIIEAPTLEFENGIRLTITVEGRAVSSGRLVSLETWSEANRVPRARLVFFEGGGDDGKNFPLSAGEELLPGRKIVISAGYEGAVEPIHSGVIVRHGIRIDPGSSPQLIIETADPLVEMTLARGSSVSENKSDKDLIAALVAAAGGAVGRNEAGAAPHEAFVRYHASPWDTLVVRAEASGCLVFVEAGKIDIVTPAGGEAVAALEYGDDIISLEAVLDAAAAVPESAADWSKLALMRAGLGAVRGTVRFNGSAAVKAGTVITLNGVGPRFEGDAFVTSVEHVFRGGAWQTSAGFGMAKESFAAAAEVTQPGAAGLVPPIRGLHTGQVTKVAPDPAGDYRAQVTLPLIGDENGVWARLAGFYASSGFGAVFRPEVGDEVVLGFMDEDPAYPVILGSLYSNGRKPDEPNAPAEANDRKAIVTRSKLEISFDDKDTAVTVKTPGGRIVRLDDTKGEIEIADADGNTILMDKDKVSITSAAELTLESRTNLSISAGVNLTIGAKAAYSLSAATIKERAELMLSIRSDGFGEIKTAAPLTIRGPLVEIN